MAQLSDKSTALWVVRRLRSAGHVALFAGGCVRDMLMGRRPADYDVATDATPDQVERLFPRVLLVGAKFGVAMVIHRGRKVEVTTFRSDVSYSDGRRPDSVRFSCPREDASRRDFTINGMFYDPVAGQVVDYVGGRRDLAAKVIRTIGRPEDRFAEDYLRMLRAVRFAVRFGFCIAPGTAAAVRKFAPRITSISGERIYEELTKMLSLDSAATALRTLDALGLAAELLPELFRAEGLWAAANDRVARLAGRRDVVLAFAGLLADLPPAEVRRLIRRWGAPNELRDTVCFLARRLNEWRTAADLPLCDFKRLLAADDFRRLLAMWRVEELTRTGRETHSRRIARRARGIAQDRIAPPPLVTGGDLKDMGLPEGPQVGRILRELYDAQLNEELRSRTHALHRAREMIRAL